MTKLQDLIADRISLKTMGFVVPAPDYSIAHEGSKGVMIECPVWRSDESVLKWIADERGDVWEKPRWIITEHGQEKEISNPHKNSHGLWVYLVRRT